MAAAAAAGYHLLQLLKCLYLGRAGGGVNTCRRSSRALAWVCLLLDKVKPRRLPPRPSYSISFNFKKEGFHPSFRRKNLQISDGGKNCLSCCYIVYRLTIDYNVIKSCINHMGVFSW
jgi:hypothetical protein